MSEYKCTEKGKFESMENDIERNSKDIQKNYKDIANVKDELTLMKINDKGVEIVVANLQNSVEKLIASIDKLKWWLLTGMLGPIILAFILAKLNF